MPIKEYFTGTDLWKTLILASGYVFLIILMFSLAARSFEFILPLLFGYCVWIAVAFTLMREQKIKNLEKYGGMKILTGPLDEEEDKGEIVEFEIGKITRYYQLPRRQRNSIIELVKTEQSMISEMDRRENIMFRIDRRQVVSKEKRKQLTYSVVKEGNVNNNEAVDYEEDDIDEEDVVEVDRDFMDDLVSFPDGDNIENNKKGKYNGKKVELKKEK